MPKPTIAPPPWHGAVGRCFDVPALWRAVAADFSGRALPCGHYIAEEAPALLLRESEGDAVDGLTHQDIAERLGVYRETATNALNELKAARVISIGRKHITILDRRRLARFAGE